MNSNAPGDKTVLLTPADFPAFSACFNSPFRIVFEVASARLTSFTACFRSTLFVGGKVTCTTATGFGLFCFFRVIVEILHFSSPFMLTSGKNKCSAISAMFKPEFIFTFLISAD